MLPSRTDIILKSIVRQYIEQAVPVSSQSIADEHGLSVSPATIRNEMAHLEQEGYLIRPHHSAGCVPSDKGYRHYVQSLSDVGLPLAEQRLISHLFHQVEREVEEWLSLTAILMARLVKNVAIVTTPRTASCRYKHLEIVSLQGPLALVVFVLQGLKVKQQLLAFERPMFQDELAAIAKKINASFSGSTRQQIMNKAVELSAEEKQVTDVLLKMMQAEDEQKYEEPVLEGWHFMLNQPEFARGNQMAPLMELVEQRNLLRTILSQLQESSGVQVVIGKENKAEIIQNYSLVIGSYGQADKASGTIGVIGPTRMPYDRVISSVAYLSLVLSELLAELYGWKTDRRAGENSD